MCECNAGFSGANGGACTACTAGTFKLTLGSAPCLAPHCPADEFFAQQASNVARMCGPQKDAACQATISSQSDANSGAFRGNDGDLMNNVHTLALNPPGLHTYMINFEQTRIIQYIVFHNRPDVPNRMVGAVVRVGSSASWADNTICATLTNVAVQTHPCNLDGQYMHIVLDSRDVMNFRELQAFSGCTACPPGATAPAGSTAAAACACRAGGFRETGVLNPLETGRTFSSYHFWGGTVHHRSSMLDNFMNADVWLADTDTAGQWLEISAGVPMQVVGVVTQGRGAQDPSQFVTSFKVQYRIGDSLATPTGSNLELIPTFSMTSGAKKEHLFDVPIYARYVRILPLTWNNWVGMRAALVVRQCSSCPATAVSLEGSTSAQACQCAAGNAQSVSAASQRALALVPGRAQLATLSNRGGRTHASTAGYSATAGFAAGTGAVTFDRAFNQYLDGGPHAFNVATNGGLTVIALVMFTGAPEDGPGERIIDFGSGNGNNNIIVSRFGTDRMLWALRNGATLCFISTDNSVIVRNSWLSVMATYRHSDMAMTLTVGSTVKTGVCSFVMADRVVTNTYVGKSWMNDPYSQISIGNVYAVDALLSTAEIAAIVGRMQRGEDALQECAACPVNTYGPGAAAALALNQPRPVNAVTARALALTPGRAQLATLATRATRPGVTTAVFDPAAGVPPDGTGAVRFVRANSQFLDGGAHTFNIASNGGFTVVAMVMLTGSVGSSERMVNFGSGQSDNNIMLARVTSTTNLWFAIDNTAASCGVQLDGVLVQNTWLTIVGTYSSVTNRIEVRVGAASQFTTCNPTRTDRTLTNTFAAKSHWPSDSFFTGSIAGLYAVDALLAPFEIAQIVTAMQVGDDVLQVGSAAAACQTCPANSTSPAASSMCQCNAGFSSENDDTCALCAPGLIKPSSGPGPCLPDFNRINNERQQAIALASQARAQLEISKGKCTDSTKLMLCPTSDAVPVDMRAACVGAMAECFVVDGVFDATALGAYKTEKQSACPNAGDRFCDQEGICIGAGASCAPASKCLPEQSFRCPNWACAADAAGCDSAATPPACPAGEQRCPDALCYPGTGGMQECAKAGVNWKGCPPGFQECTNGKDGTCGTDAADCEAKVGCPAHLVFCGILRDENGTATIDPVTGRPFARCVVEAACLAGQDRPPVDISGPLDPSVAGSIAAVSADGQPAMELRMGAGAFTVNGIAQAVTFSVSAVPDSLVQQGAFGSLFESGSLVASLIHIQPSAAVEIVGGMILDIPILDEQANLDPALCDLILANTQILSVSDITDVTQEPAPTGMCTKGVIGGCSCAVSVTHFSTFTVADVSVQSQSCPSNRYMVTRVMNPPFAMRTFTTRAQGTGVMQLLPWNLFATPWRPTTYNTAQYMQIDLGQELTVLGIRTQNSGGISHQYTSAFQLHHAASTGGFTVQSQVHTLTNNDPTNIILTTSFMPGTFAS